MKPTSIRTAFCFAVGVALAFMVGSPSYAQSGGEGFHSPFPEESQAVQAFGSTLHGFAKHQYLLKSGGTPPTLKQMAAHPDGPRHFFRHENAYQAFKGGFEERLGRQLSDAAFVQLLGSSGVRDTSDCVGWIDTNRIDDFGKIGDKSRPCMRGEKLIEVMVNGRWVVVASQACLNQVFKVWQPQPKPKPQKCGWVSDGNNFHPGGVFSSPGIHVHTEFCGHDLNTFIPGNTFVLPGQVTKGARWVCQD